MQGDTSAKVEIGGRNKAGFGADWIVMGDAGGTPPPLTAFPLVAKATRDLLMSRWKGKIPEGLSGHDQDGGATRKPHIALVPLACVGGPDSDGRLMGLAIVPPGGAEGADKRRTIREVMDGIDESIGPAGSLPCRLTLGALGVWHVERRTAPYSYFLNPNRYLEPSTRWATVTPIVLDQHPKTRSNDHSSEHHNEDAPDRSMRGIIAQSCAYSGLPKPLRVEPMVQSKLAGAAAALVDGRAWSEAGWRLPRRDNGLAHPFGSRPITHAVIEFAGPLSGPVLLGAGRFLGMGLCLPIP